MALSANANARGAVAAVWRDPSGDGDIRRMGPSVGTSRTADFSAGGSGCAGSICRIALLNLCERRDAAFG